MAASSLDARDAKNHEVTGPALEVTPAAVTVQKGNDKWELARNSDAEIKGDFKVGARVTIHYTMSATEVGVKETKAKK